MRVLAEHRGRCSTTCSSTAPHTWALRRARVPARRPAAGARAATSTSTTTRWTLAALAVDEPGGVPGRRSGSTRDEQIDRPQVALVVDLLVRRDPRYEEIVAEQDLPQGAPRDASSASASRPATRAASSRGASRARSRRTSTARGARPRRRLGRRDRRGAGRDRAIRALRVLRHRAPLGVAANRNSCVAGARGGHIAWLDADDAYLPGALAARLAVLERHPRVGLVHGGFEVIDAAGRQLRPWPAAATSDASRPAPTRSASCRRRNDITTSTVVVRARRSAPPAPFATSIGAEQHRLGHVAAARAARRRRLPRRAGRPLPPARAARSAPARREAASGCAATCASSSTCCSRDAAARGRPRRAPAAAPARRSRPRR